MGESEFKHISVTAAEEDDFVIRAGAVDEVPEEVEEAVDKVEEVADEPEEVFGEASEEAEDVVDESESRVKPAPPAARYRETTLEDLNSEQMPMTQKVVIAAAIVCIIGAIVYYFVFMG